MHPQNSHHHMQHLLHHDINDPSHQNHGNDSSRMSNQNQSHMQQHSGQGNPSGNMVEMNGVTDEWLGEVAQDIVSAMREQQQLPSFLDGTPFPDERLGHGPASMMHTPHHLASMMMNSGHVSNPVVDALINSGAGSLPPSYRKPGSRARGKVVGGPVSVNDMNHMMSSLGSSSTGNGISPSNSSVPTNSSSPAPGLPHLLSPEDLANAAANHADAKAKMCRYCAKGFKNNFRLERHERIHTGEKPYLCGECGKAFSDRSALVNHERVHTGEKRYQCATCGRQFSRNYNLVAHQATHTGEKNYECGLCGKKFAVHYVYLRHEKQHHETSEEFGCSACDRKFTSSKSLKRHEKSHEIGAGNLLEELHDVNNAVSHSQMMSAALMGSADLGHHQLGLPRVAHMLDFQNHHLQAGLHHPHHMMEHHPDESDHHQQLRHMQVHHQMMHPMQSHNPYGNS